MIKLAGVLQLLQPYQVLQLLGFLDVHPKRLFAEDALARVEHQAADGHVVGVDHAHVNDLHVWLGRGGEGRAGGIGETEDFSQNIHVYILNILETRLGTRAGLNKLKYREVLATANDIHTVPICY